MTLQNNILSFDGPRSVDRRFGLKEGHRKTVDACRQVLLRTLPRLMEQMFGRLDDALYELADKSDNNSRQTAYFDAMREVRIDRERIEAGFKANVLESYDRFWSAGPAVVRHRELSTESGAEEFSLVENEDLEEGLAFNNMISRGENRYYQELYSLDQRISHLIGGGEIDRASNPLAPAVICDAFHQVARGMSLEVPIKLVIYKQFEREVVDSLGEFYLEINNLLIQAGVLPRLTREVRRREGHQSLRSSGETDDGQQDERVDDGSIDEEEAELQAELFSTLQQLLGRRRVLPPAVAERRARLPVVDTSNVVSALSSLQRACLTQEPSDNPVIQGEADIRVNLQRAIQIGHGDQQVKQISQTDEDAIDVISMLFEFILEDRNLADAMKAQLARLQIPMLKVAILDKAFFSSKNHPARRLLNSLAQAAIGWTESQGREDGGLYAKIESIVERILTGFDSDIDLFPKLTEEFNAFLEQEEKGSKVMEQRVAQVTQGKEQLQNARHRVFEEINNRLFSQGNVPEVVVALLKDGWKDVLLLIGLRQGFESPEWQKALNLMDRLLWSIEPKAEKGERQKLLKEIPVLLKGLRVGLNSITYDQHKMAKLFKELQACHVNCLKGSPVPLVVATPEGRPILPQSGPEIGVEQFLEIERSEQQPETQKERVENIVLKTTVSSDPLKGGTRDKHQELAEDLEIGTWLEVREDDKTTNRAKLSWRSQISGSCLFVNRKGMKVAELTSQGLAAWFRNGKAVVLKEVGVPLMDRALKAVVNELKDEDNAKDNT